MLSSIAGNCFWMARYLERAENTARLVEMAHHQALQPETSSDDVAAWADAFAIGGDQDDFSARHGALTRTSAATYLVLDRQNPGSLVACLRAARENARTGRHLFTDAYWEAINASWLAAQALEGKDLERLEQLIEWAIGRCQHIRGANADLLRDELPEVINAGAAVERIDYTARLLSVMLPTLVQAGEGVAVIGSAGYHRWDALLCAAGVQDMYRRFSKRIGHLGDTVELLLFHREEPRSAMHNLGLLERSLRAFTRGGPCRAIPQVTSLLNLLSTNSTGFLNGDWQEVLTQLRALNAQVSDTMNGDHFAVPEQ